MILRPYQATMVDAIRDAWAAGQRRVLGSLATGAGKSEIAIEIIRTEATPENRVLVLVERKVLAHQWVARFKRHGIVDVGVLQAGNSRRLYASIVVATAQSIRTRGIPEGVNLIVIDESHIWHKSHDHVLDRATEARVLGLTATPLREGLGLRFDTIVTGATIRDLIHDGHLVQPRYFAPAGDDVARALETVSIRAGDFAVDQLSAAMRSKSIIGDVVGTWQRRGENRQTIVFAVDKQHARELADEFAAVGVAAEVIIDDTSDEDRLRIFGAFDSRAVRVLCSVGVLSIGFDSPVASCAILARPTMSTSLHIQQGGRVLRPFEGKTDALLLDHAGNTLTHGRLEDFEPPTDLSMIDRKTDKKNRRDPSQGWTCRACHAINSHGDDICLECGTPRRRHTAVVVLDGELVEVEVTLGQALPGPTPENVRDFYRMATWYGKSKAFTKPEAWAYYATQRRFNLDAQASKRVISWDWRYAEPLVPDAAASRWFRADYQRTVIARRYGQQKAQSSTFRT